MFGILKEIPLSMQVFVPMVMGKIVHLPNLFLAIRREVFASLGKYKVGIRAYSKWGINVHYKLHGLEPTNDNAFKRIVVLHSYTPLPATEVYPSHLPLGMSQGCPVICNETMRQIDVLLKAETKPVLLWIYND